MTILKTWGGQGLATGSLTTSSAGTGDNPFDTVAAGLTIASDGVRSPCIGVPDGTGPLAAAWNLTTQPAWSIRVYYKAGTNEGIFATAYAGSSKIVQLDFNSTGKLRLTGTVSGANSVRWTSTNVPATGTWWRVEATYTASSGAWTVAYYAADATTATESGSGTQDTNLSLSSLSVGRVGSTTAGMFVDDIAVADSATFIGPPTVTPPPTTSTLQVFNGAAWVNVTRSIIVTA